MRRPRALSAAVLVPTIGRPAFLLDCVAAIAADLGPDDELVVADGGGSHADVALVGLPGRTRTVDGPGGGKSWRLDLAAATVDRDLLLFTDDDCRVRPGWIDAMAAPFADPRVGIAFGTVDGLTNVPGEGPPPGPPPGPAPALSWTFAHGSAMAVRRSAFEAVGGFDERLGPGEPAIGEEHDLLLRLRERGWTVAVADAPPIDHLDWRDGEAEEANALVYERGAGAFIGAAIRRRPRSGLDLLKHRAGYQRALFDQHPDRPRGFGRRALVAFGGGLLYGLRLRRHPAPPG